MNSSTAARLAATGSVAVLIWTAAAGPSTAADSQPDPQPGATTGVPTGADVALALHDGTLDLTLGGPELLLDERNRTTVPDDAAHAFLGRPGDTVWQWGDGVGESDPRWDTAAVGADALGPDGLQWSLDAVQGPGALVVYEPADADADADADAADAGDALAAPVPQPVFDSRDGLPDRSALPPTAAGRLVWAFTRPGDYAITATATAVLASGERTATTVHWTARVADPQPAPTPSATSAGARPALAPRLLKAADDAPATSPVTIDDGHVDALAGRLVDGRLRLLFKDSRRPDAVVWREPSSVVVHVNDKARQRVPSNSTYAFLGPAGSTFWLIPQVQQAGVVWAGWNTEALRDSDLKGPVDVKLTGVAGPGSVAVWETAGLGGAQIVYNSRDGLPDSQRVNLGVHAHANWGFSAPGTYRLTFRLSGTLASGQDASDTRTYTFTVGDGDTGGPTRPTAAPSGTPGAVPPAPGTSTTGTPTTAAPTTAAPIPGSGPTGSTPPAAATTGATGTDGGSATPPGGTLAQTGSGVLPLGAAAAALVAGGTAVAALARRGRRATG
ncbi:choice-of-anchor M domain-containing protein [Streptomyces sp. NPDC092296]|uniref:choice-of-anchor M domain-containing protein n=1 Tax=Streptomyces sp. NPDC092296 TaxID=3366012 RepID=UPI00380AF067